jgi:hypothetical protein
VQTASTAAALIEDEQGVRAGRSTMRLRYDEGCGRVWAIEGLVYV